MPIGLPMRRSRRSATPDGLSHRSPRPRTSARSSTCSFAWPTPSTFIRPPPWIRTAGRRPSRRERMDGTVKLALAAMLALGAGQIKDSIAAPQVPAPSPESLVTRARRFELDTPYVPPPGDPLEHHTAGFAKIMCSAVFVTGLDPDFAAEHVGYFTSPYDERKKVGKPVIDRAAREVRVTMANGTTLTAKYLGRQGCVTLPIGKTTVNFTPIDVKSALPDPATTPWPMGDLLPNDPLPRQLDAG